ncbi:MAG: ABC transporter permease [Candidatus Methylomirabilales bacterium]
MRFLKGSRIALRAVTANKLRALLAILGRVTGWPTAVSSAAIFLAFGVAAAVGIFFGAYPARRAARLDPIVALRAE